MVASSARRTVTITLPAPATLTDAVSLASRAPRYSPAPEMATDCSVTLPAISAFSAPAPASSSFCACRSSMRISVPPAPAIFRAGARSEPAVS